MLNLIFSLISDVESRIGKHGMEEIQTHPFFVGIDWKQLSRSQPPFVPELSSAHDTKYFPILSPPAQICVDCDDELVISDFECDFV